MGPNFDTFWTSQAPLLFIVQDLGESYGSSQEILVPTWKNSIQWWNYGLNNTRNSRTDSISIFFPSFMGEIPHFSLVKSPIFHGKEAYRFVAPDLKNMFTTIRVSHGHFLGAIRHKRKKTVCAVCAFRTGPRNKRGKAQKLCWIVGWWYSNE